MNQKGAQPMTPRHVLAVPFPGRGDINPVLDLCNSIISRTTDVDFTLAVNEEWLAVYESEQDSSTRGRIRFACLKNILLADLAKSGNFLGFIEAVLTKMEDPLEKLLDRLENPPCILIADAHLLSAAVKVCGRRNIPVAAFWPTSAAMFTLYHHFHLLEQHRHFPLHLSESGNKRVDYIPGLSSTSLDEILRIFVGLHDYILPKFREAYSLVSKSNCFLMSTIYELDQHAVDALKLDLQIPVYTVASPSSNRSRQNAGKPDYIEWLDAKPDNSVLYIAMGSHVPVSPTQMEEIIAGLLQSGVFFLLVARSTEADELRPSCGEKGFVVSWCDQITVLSHKAVGGFWSHCGWNSTKEGVFAGVPFLTFPVYGDQIMISKLIVEDWKTGWRIKEDIKDENEVKREAIAEIVKKFMDVECDESRELRRNAQEMQKKVVGAFEEDGSFEVGISSFIQHIFAL